MGQRSVYDPHDPWAFRNTWTGEIRNSYDDLWIWITLIIGLTLLALCILIPVLVHIYCRDCCQCLPWCRCYDRLLSVCYTMSWEQREQSRERRRQKSQQIDFEEPYNVPSSESETFQAAEQHRPRPIHRSYPQSFYPRSVTLPPTTTQQTQKNVHSAENPGRVREPSVPRLKL
ncbi:hypothetical protein V3C99_011074 [Haemonchus contortus]